MTNIELYIKLDACLESFHFVKKFIENVENL